MKYLISLCFITIIGCQSNDDYVDEILEWRKGRVERLIAPVGWASLSGLFWIEKDSITLGGLNEDIKFNPSVENPIAHITRESEQLVMTARVEGITESNEPFQSGRIFTDIDTIVSSFSYNQWQWMFIERGDKIGLRLWDTTHVNRSKYTVLDYFPIDEKFRITAEYVTYETPLEKTLRNVLGMDVPQVIPGELQFSLEGGFFRLQVLNGNEDEFFIIFADETTGGDTYGGGRYLYSPKPKDGSTQCYIDFNKAYTPPCGFTEFATCLLPTKENTIPIEIKAGEMYLFDH